MLRTETNWTVARASFPFTASTTALMKLTPWVIKLRITHVHNSFNISCTPRKTRENHSWKWLILQIWTHPLVPNHEQTSKNHGDEWDEKRKNYLWKWRQDLAAVHVRSSIPPIHIRYHSAPGLSSTIWIQPIAAVQMAATQQQITVFLVCIMAIPIIKFTARNIQWNRRTITAQNCQFPGGANTCRVVSSQFMGEACNLSNLLFQQQ